MLVVFAHPATMMGMLCFLLTVVVHAYLYHWLCQLRICSISSFWALMMS